MASPRPAGDDFDEIIYKKVKLGKNKRSRRVTTKVLIEWFVFVCIASSLVASFTVGKLLRMEIWVVNFCGMLVTRWFMHIVVFLIETNFLLRKKVLYFVHGLKECVQVFIWLRLVLLMWVLLIKHGVDRSELATKILNGVTWTLVSLLIGAFLWLIKTLLLKILASNFQVKSFFDRIQESLFHQYILQTLSGPPLVEEALPSVSHFSLRSTDGRDIDIAKLHQMKQEKVSSWTMKVLVDAMTNSGLSTISTALNESFHDAENEQTDKQITNEMEATAAAHYIFRNIVAPGCTYIDEDELGRFMIKEDVRFVFVMHPFAVGDRCVIDGVELLVEEMNILTTVLLKLNNEKVYYPNSVLATKPISNYYRSSDMGDGVEFSIDFMTPAENIGALKVKLKRYPEKNPQYWHPNRDLLVKEIEDVNKIKMGVYVTHTMNFQEFGEKGKRRTELMMEIKKIFEELNIRYNLLPQGVHLGHMEPDKSVLHI
uniref:Uncharacterized protein At5g12080 family n=1 Tax=Cajanus cajan TaxID=3821 RepID=A0A151RSR3_CAJCA|nr:Uncharacterized protein At5g12080 family [Cajanus cajan]